MPHDAPWLSAPEVGQKIEAARSAGEDERFKTGHAGALLEMLGEHIGAPGLCTEDMECQEPGLRVEYLALQIGRHAEDLANEMEKIERAAMALRRGDEAEPEPTPATWRGSMTRNMGISE